MMQRRSRSFGVCGRLLVLATAACLAVLVSVLISNKPAQSDTAFEYALPVNAAELSDAELDRTLDKAKSAGVNSISSGAVWWYLNEGRPPRSYDWSSLDRLIAGAEKRGMKVSLQLSGTPDWVHLRLKDRVPNFFDRIWYPPRGDKEIRHWSNFVTDVVSRYKGRVVRYEMWNEPNIDTFWKPSPNPAEYAALLRASYSRAKRAHPGAGVAFAGLSRNDVGYVNAYYSKAKKYSGAAGARYFFDVMDVHPYSSMRSSGSGEPEQPLSPDVNTTSAVFDGTYGAVDQNFLGIKKVKAAMDAQGDSGKPIFLGEYGFPTTDTWMKGVPDQTRASYLKSAYTNARNLPYVEGMSWYHYRPNSADAPEWAIVHTNLNETMTFQALREITGREPAPG
jgi:aryl-phospho-beta-D-glucosidase BglC (GH1 family)